MSETARRLTQTALTATGGRAAQLQSVDFVGMGNLPSAFPVTDFAAATIATAGLAIADLLVEVDSHAPRVTVDRRLASFWFRASIRPIGWAPPPVWDPIAGDYQA